MRDNSSEKETVEIVLNELVDDAARFDESNEVKIEYFRITDEYMLVLLDILHANVDRSKIHRMMCCTLNYDVNVQLDWGVNSPLVVPRLSQAVSSSIIDLAAERARLAEQYPWIPRDPEEAKYYWDNIHRPDFDPDKFAKAKQTREKIKSYDLVRQVKLPGINPLARPKGEASALGPSSPGSLDEPWTRSLGGSRTSTAVERSVDRGMIERSIDRARGGGVSGGGVRERYASQSRSRQRQASQSRPPQSRDLASSYDGSDVMDVMSPRRSRGVVAPHAGAMLTWNIPVPDDVYVADQRDPVAGRIASGPSRDLLDSDEPYISPPMPRGRRRHREKSALAAQPVEAVSDKMITPPLRKTPPAPSPRTGSAVTPTSSRAPVPSPVKVPHRSPLPPLATPSPRAAAPASHDTLVSPNYSDRGRSSRLAPLAPSPAASTPKSVKKNHLASTTKSPTLASPLPGGNALLRSFPPYPASMPPMVMPPGKKPNTDAMIQMLMMQQQMMMSMLMQQQQPPSPGKKKGVGASLPVPNMYGAGAMAHADAVNARQAAHAGSVQRTVASKVSSSQGAALAKYGRK